MSDTKPWAFDESLQPRAEELDFDLAPVLDAVVLLRAEIPDDAFTSSILGTERIGYGVVIRENGLVQALGDLRAPVLERGSVATVATGDEVYVIGHGGRSHALKAKVFAKREFAGYWEYLIDDALFTAPAHPQWGGAALVDQGGRLVGIGSLLLQETVGEEADQGNMFVPIDLVEPILEDLIKRGRAARASRPWLGMYTQQEEGRLIVAGLAPGSPADRAGVKAGDLVLGVAGERTTSLADFFRRVWRLGEPGVEVPLMLARQGDVLRLSVRSADRNDFLKKPRLH